MSVSFNTSLNGVYTLFDANRQEICRSNNIITNWGMSRLVGDPSLASAAPNATWSRAFVNNLSRLFIGSSNTLVQRNDHQLGSRITTGFNETNDSAVTGTDFNVSGNDLNIKFTKSVKFDFTSSATVSEVGCHWGTTFDATAANGIFSRATVPTRNFNTGDTIFLKYELTIKTNVHQILQSLPFNVGSDAVTLPNSKTNVRYFPFYRLGADGNPQSTLNNGVDKFTSTPLAALPEQIPPIFEDFGSLNTRFVGSGNNSSITTDFRQSGARKWRLQIYNTISLPSFSNIISSTLTNFNNTPNVGTTTQNTSDPLETASVLKRINLNSNVFTSNPASDSWQRRLRFIFTPGQWNPSTDRMMLFQISDGFAGGVPRSYINNSLDCGILTTFENPYNPYSIDPDIYVGFDYTFNFTRSVV